MRQLAFKALLGLIPLGCVFLLFHSVGLTDQLASAINLSGESRKGVVAVPAEVVVARDETVTALRQQSTRRRSGRTHAPRAGSAAGCRSTTAPGALPV